MKDKNKDSEVMEEKEDFPLRWYEYVILVPLVGVFWVLGVWRKRK